MPAEPIPPGRRPRPSPAAFWQRFDAVEARLTAVVSERMLDLAAVAAGQRVLDLASGRGEPALRAAQRTGPGGRVLAVEPDAGLAAALGAEAERQGLAQLVVRQAPAEALADLPADGFDVVTCRWGLMYLREPLLALRHVRRALRGDGVLVAGMWASPAQVEWHTLPRQLLACHRPVPAAALDAPGPFRFADSARTARELAGVGLQVVHEESMQVPVVEATTANDLVDWACGLGLAPLLAELPDAAQWAWERAFVQALAERRRDGVIRLGGTTRLLLARRQ